MTSSTSPSSPSPPAASAPPATSMRTFAITWLGQLVSLIGSGLTDFAIAVSVFTATRSATQFALITFFYTLPALLLAPVAGALVDRWDRRRAMLVADAGGALAALAIVAVVLASDAGWFALRPWHFYAPLAVGAAFAALRWPALVATTPLLVPRQHLGRANGLLELANMAGQILSPVLAGLALGRIGLGGVVLLDAASFVVAIATLLVVRFPRPPASAEGAQAGDSLVAQARFGWRYIRARPGLWHLLVVVAVSNLLGMMVMLLFTPLVLTFSDASRLGFILTIASIGGIGGAVVMSVWGGPRRRVNGILIALALSGIVLFAGALRPTVLLVTVTAFLFLFPLPILSSSMLAIWQSKVPPDLHGRVFSVRRMVGLAAPPLAALITGPLVEHVFEPWLQPGGALAASVGRIIGVGPGRGMGFLLVILGALFLLLVAVAAASSRMRRVEDELPDMLGDPRSKPGRPDPSGPMQSEPTQSDSLQSDTPQSNPGFEPPQSNPRSDAPRSDPSPSDPSPSDPSPSDPSRSDPPPSAGSAS